MTLTKGSKRPDPFSENDRVHILLHEYDTLRSELVANGVKRFQLLAIGGGLFVIVASRPIDRRFWITLILAALGLLLFTLANVRNTKRLARRVSEIEATINQRTAEELLVWERRWGAAATGFLFQSAPLPPDPSPPEELDPK
jgi:hypothetical protein